MDQNQRFIYNKNNYFSGNNYFYCKGKELNKIRGIKHTNTIFSLRRNYLKNYIDNKDKYSSEMNNINNINDKYNKNKYNFCKFLSYIICCGTNNKKMNYVEELRYKILSEETIVQNYLNLKKMNKLPEFVK